MKNTIISEFVANQKITIIKCDLSDLDKLEKIKTKIKGTTTLIHLSAQITNNNDLSIALNQIEFNSISLLRLINSLPKIQHIIFSSSYFIYGGEGKDQLTESSEAKLVNFYSLGKLSAEKILKVFGRTKNIPISILRFSSLYGSILYKENFIHNCLIKAKANQKITIFGNGQKEKDYLFIEDAAKAIELSLEKRANGTYNIGSSKSFSLTEIANLAVKITKSNSKIVTIPGNQKNLYFNLICKKAEDDLGFKPTFSIEEGMKTIIGSL